MKSHKTRTTRTGTMSERETGIAQEYMVCNHFFPIYTTSRMIPRSALPSRAGPALYCDRYLGANFLIPIEPIKGFVDKKRIARLLVQVKNRVGNTMASGLSIESASSVMSAAKELGLTIRYSGLMMCLRGQKTGNRGRLQTLAITQHGPKDRRYLRR